MYWNSAGSIVYSGTDVDYDFAMLIREANDSTSHLFPVRLPRGRLPRPVTHQKRGL